MKFSYSHLAVRVDIFLLIQPELISDMHCLMKPLQLLHQMYDAESVSCKPFTTEREQTNGNPDSIETCCGIRTQIKRVNDEQCSRKDIDALI